MKYVTKIALIAIVASGLTDQARADIIATDFPTVVNYDQYADGNVEVPGRLFIPAQAVANPTQKYPLVIYLHGAGGIGTDNNNQIWDGDNGNHNVYGNIGNLVIAAKSNGFYIYAPQSQNGTWEELWRINDAFLAAGKVARDYNIDVNRVYVTGLSAGGGGTWLAISNFTNMLAAAVPICGNNTVTGAKVLNKPIWAFHARNDGTVSVDTYSRANINLIRNAETPALGSLGFPLVGSSYYNYYAGYAGSGTPEDGASYYNFHNLIYSEYTSGGHFIWGNAYGETPLYTWLLSQNQSSAATPITQLAAGEKLLFDFGSTITGTVSGQVWNSPGGTNSSALPAAGVGSANGTERTISPVVVFAYANTGHRTPVTLSVTKVFNSVATGTTSTVYPASVAGEGWEQGAFNSNADSITNCGELLLSGLVPSAQYNLKFYGSDTSPYNNCPTRYTINNSSTLYVDLVTLNNTSNFGLLNNVAADSNGQIRIEVAPSPSSTFHALFSNISALEVAPVASGGGTAPNISGTPPNFGYPQTAYNNGFNYYLTVTGTTPITYAVTGGSFPMGISLDTDATGPYIHGTVYNGQSGPYSATITASNGTLPNATFTVPITIYVSPAFTSGVGPSTATVGVNYNNSVNGFTVTAAGYPTPTLSATGLPPGMTFTPATGKLAGMPTAAGSYTVVVTALNNYQSGNHSTPLNIPITVAAATSAPSISGTAPAGTVNTAYTFGYTVTGSPAPTLSVGSGALPPGVVISGNGITGTPTTAGSYSGTIVATNGVGSPASVSFNIVISTSGTLPTGWASADIGTTGALGSASQSAGVYTLTGSGNDIWGYNDSFRFLYQSATLDGDGSIIARVDDIQNTGPWAKSGIMMRASMATGSQQAMMCLSPTGNGAASFMYRAVTSDVSNAVTNYNSPAPIWFRLTRAGNLFTGAVSSTGADNSWTTVGSQTITMPTSIYVGMVECSTASGTLATAHFSNVSVSSAMSQLAIGSSTTGSSSISGGTYSVTSTTSASGDIWGSSDNFYYLYAPMPGDGTVTVQVTNMTNSSPWSKCGIMIRKGLSASSAHASVFYTPGQGGASAQANMYYRLSDGNITDYSGVGGNYGATAYLRLVRVGSTVTASISSTGAAGSYTTLGSQTITGLTGSVYVGLVECSHAATAGTATFNPVSLP